MVFSAISIFMWSWKFNQKRESGLIFLHWKKPAKWRKQFNKTESELNLIIAKIHHSPVKILFYRNSSYFEDCIDTLKKVVEDY